MSKPTSIGRNFKWFIEDADGEFVPLEIWPRAKPSPPVVCIPTPCRGGFEYVPDWYRITHFG